MADIELVIKIPKEIYKALQIIDVKHEDVIQIPLEVIANGTPLPKGHGRLIDEREVYKKFYCRCLARVAKEVLDETPTIIEADKESEDKK